jgi:hypothetical protein
LHEFNPFTPKRTFEKEKKRLYEKFDINIEEYELNCKTLNEIKIKAAVRPE